MEVGVIYLSLPIIYFYYTKLFWICQVILIKVGVWFEGKLTKLALGRSSCFEGTPPSGEAITLKRTPFQRPRSFYFYFTSSNDTLGSLSAHTYYQLFGVDRNEFLLVSIRIWVDLIVPTLFERRVILAIDNFRLNFCFVFVYSFGDTSVDEVGLHHSTQSLFPCSEGISH